MRMTGCLRPRTDELLVINTIASFRMTEFVHECKTRDPTGQTSIKVLIRACEELSE